MLDTSDASIDHRDAASEDSVADITADSGAARLTLPAEIAAEVVFSSTVGATTPPTWNAHLPKLVGDEQNFYAVFTHFPDATVDRYAAVARRPRAGGAWQQVARLAYVHQPPGIVMTRAGALHMVFDCLRPAATDAQCFTGGAGTGGLQSRFYRLVFSSRSADGALRWDTYGNYGEWSAESNGYLGLAVAPDDSVQWSLANSAWARVVFRATNAAGSAIATLSEPGRYLLYPQSAWDGARSLLFAGEFEPSGGSNAGYPATSLYALGASATPSRVLRVTPEVSVGAGMVGAYPSDLEVASDRTVYALAYQRRAGGCSTLFRSDGGDRFTPLPVGCLDTYARLQLVDDRTLVLLSSAGGTSLRVGTSEDRGDSWRWSTIPIRGTLAADQTLYGYTLIDPRNSPAIYQPDRVRMVFSGSDAAGLSRTLYFAEWPLR